MYMKKNDTPLAKKIRIILFSFSGIVLFFFIGLVIKIRMDRNFLLNNGVRVKGAVLYKYEQTKNSRKGTKHNYQMELSLFVDSSITAPAKPKTESFEDKMDALLANSKKRMQSQYHEGYAKVIIEVSGDSYEKFSLGEVVDVIHLKDDPSSAKLTADI